jgi:hypothetical protein
MRILNVKTVKFLLLNENTFNTHVRSTARCDIFATASFVSLPLGQRVLVARRVLLAMNIYVQQMMPSDWNMELDYGRLVGSVISRPP